MPRINPDKKPLKALGKLVTSWGTICAFFIIYCAAVWRYLESSRYAPYLIVVGFSLCAFLAALRVFRENRCLRYGAPAALTVVLFVIAHSLTVCTELPVEPPKKTEWLPPELPPRCSNVVVKFGADSFNFPLPLLSVSSEKSGTKVADDLWLRLAEIQMTFGTRTFAHPLRPEVKDNRLYLSVLVPYQNDRKRISMDNALDRHLPAMWDRNFTSNAFEIVQHDNTPVLQVIYRRADVIEVYGIFVLDAHHVFVTFGATNSMWVQNLTADSTNVTADSTAFILPTAAFEADFAPRNPIFKYPSWKYMGVFSE